MAPPKLLSLLFVVCRVSSHDVAINAIMEHPPAENLSDLT
jgi:hypothetical protein